MSERALVMGKQAQQQLHVYVGPLKSIDRKSGEKEIREWQIGRLIAKHLQGVFADSVKCPRCRDTYG